MEYHTTQDGRKIKLKDLDSKHLQNIIKWIERKAKEGLNVASISRGPEFDDIRAFSNTEYGEEAKYTLNYDAYIEELKKRGINYEN